MERQVLHNMVLNCKLNQVSRSLHVELLHDPVADETRLSAERCSESPPLPSSNGLQPVTERLRAAEWSNAARDREASAPRSIEPTRLAGDQRRYIRSMAHDCESPSKSSDAADRLSR